MAEILILTGFLVLIICISWLACRYDQHLKRKRERKELLAAARRHDHRSMPEHDDAGLEALAGSRGPTESGGIAGRLARSPRMDGEAR